MTNEEIKERASSNRYYKVRVLLEIPKEVLSKEGIDGASDFSWLVKRIVEKNNDESLATGVPNVFLIDIDLDEVDMDEESNADDLALTLQGGI